MKVISFAIVLLICTIACAQQDTSGIKWTDEYFLTWDDFQGKEDVSLSLSALSKIAIPYSYSSDGEVDLTINLNTFFITDESWYKKGKENKILLAHEQLHFDIAEVHRRLIVKAIMNTKFSSENYELQLKNVVNDIWDNEYREMQDLYDKETNYARIFKSQIKWNKFIANKLEAFKQYKANEITVTFN